VSPLYVTTAALAEEALEELHHVPFGGGVEECKLVADLDFVGGTDLHVANVEDQ
jgi:hypothetical protein